MVENKFNKTTARSRQQNKITQSNIKRLLNNRKKVSTCEAGSV